MSEKERGGGDWLTAESQLGFQRLLHLCIYCLDATDPEIYSIYFCLTPFLCEYNIKIIAIGYINTLKYFISPVCSFEVSEVKVRKVIVVSVQSTAVSPQYPHIQ